MSNKDLLQMRIDQTFIQMKKMYELAKKHNDFETNGYLEALFDIMRDMEFEWRHLKREIV